MIRVIDIETTGLDPDKDAIVEIATITLTADGGYSDPWEVIVDPGVPIPPRASAVHHITDADVRGAPKLADVLSILSSDVWIAHNAKFERSFLERHGLKGEWICTMKCALRQWGNSDSWPGASNQELRYWLGLIDPLGVKRAEINPHRALSDCLVTGAIFHHLSRDVRFSDMKAWSSEPAVYPVLTFGKHRGMRLREAPADYLDWLATGRHEMEEDWRYTARTEIDRRRAGAN